MSKVVREDIDNLNTSITITLTKDDYEPKVNVELNKYRKQAHMKGFRKGRTPASVVRKMYGKAVLAEVINELLQKEIVDFIAKEELNILGQPLPSKDQEEQEFDLKSADDYVFKFDLGLSPDFEVKGLDTDNQFDRFLVEIGDEEITEELEAARKQLGERVFPEEDILENDLIKFSGKEMEGDAIKKDGIESEFSVLVSGIDNEDLKKEILGLKNGAVLTADITQLESNKEEAHIRKYLLNLPEDDDRSFNNTFELTIEEVSRVAPAELNQDFFDKSFGPDAVHSEEEAKDKIREGIGKQYESQSDALLFRDFQERLLEQNELELPDAFLMRWLQTSNEGVAMEVIEKEYETFNKNLQWSLIRSKIAKENELEISQEELTEGLRDRVRGYFGSMGGMGGGPEMEQLVDTMVERLKGDEKQVEQVYEDLLSDKLHDVIAGKVMVNDQSIAKEAFNEKIEEARAAAAAIREAVQGTSEEE